MNVEVVQKTVSFHSGTNAQLGSECHPERMGLVYDVFSRMQLAGIDIIAKETQAERRILHRYGYKIGQRASDSNGLTSQNCVATWKY